MSARLPWAGHWWPMQKAELALGWEDGRDRRRWSEFQVRTFDSYLASVSRSGRRALSKYLDDAGIALSPLMKFDLWARLWLESRHGPTHLSASMPFHATRWELDYHFIGDDPEHRHHASSHFAGKCLGWALSTFDWDEPICDVELLGIVFRPADIKGLLASVYNAAQFFVPNECFVGHTYRDLEGHNSRAYYDDVDPHDFVRALASTLGQGRMLEGDLCTGHEVWNHPIHSYGLIHGPIRKGRVEVEATLGYADNDFDIDATFSVGEERPDLVTRTLHFELELPRGETDLGRATGGRWLGASIDEHPDTLILGLEPDWRNKVYPYRRTQMLQEVNFPLIKRVPLEQGRVPLVDILLADYYAANRLNPST